MIVPTLGRVVWFTPYTGDPMPTETDGRCAALVCKVFSERLVNLAVFDANGNQQGKTSVCMVQEGDPKPPGGFYAEWMPYQTAQAKKHSETP